MRYSIPVSKMDKLEKIISRYTKKGANIQFDIVGDVVETGTLYVYDKRTHQASTHPIQVRCKDVIVSGQYKINGWRFLGTIQFTDNGNIIRLADSTFEGFVPEKYKHTPKICEHCNTIRNRKDMYLIYNENTREFKQVGSTCLLDYTQGLDADECASIMSCLNKCEEIGNLDYTEDDFFASGYQSNDCGIDTKVARKYAICLIKRYGYSKMEQGWGSAQDLADFYFQNGQDDEWEKRYGSLKLATDEEVEEISNYAKQHIDDNFEYMRSAALAWLNSSWEYRDFGLVTSFVYTYLKEKREVIAKVQDKNNVHVGNIGDRISFVVKSARCLYVKDNSYISYYADCSYFMEIIDTEGHTFVWSASTSNIDEGDKITATIKSHDEYRGKKQTVITRGRISHE